MQVPERLVQKTPCSGCGKEFGAKSLVLHQRQCSSFTGSSAASSAAPSKTDAPSKIPVPVGGRRGSNESVPSSNPAGRRGSNDASSSSVPHPSVRSEFRRAPGSDVGVPAGRVASRTTSTSSTSSVPRRSGPVGTTRPGKSPFVGGMAASHEHTNAYMDKWKAAGANTDLPAGGAKSSATASLSDGPAVTLIDAPMAAGWQSGPNDPAGILFDASDQPLLCMSVLGQEAVVGSCDHGLQAIDITTGKLRRTLFTKTCGHTEWVTCVRHLPDGRVLSGGMDSKLCLWDARGAKCVDIKGHAGSISAVEVSGSGTLAVSGSYDKTLRAWNLKTRSEIALFKGHSGPILDFLWTHNSIVSASRDSTARIWDATTAQSVCTLKGHGGHVTAICPFDDDSLDVFCTGAQDGVFRVWDARSGRAVTEVVVHPGGAVNCAERGYERCGGEDIVATAGADKAVLVLDPRQGFAARHRITDHTDFVYSLHVAAGLILSGAGDGKLLVHDSNSGTCFWGVGANAAAVRCIWASPTQMVASGDDGNVLCYAFA